MATITFSYLSHTFIKTLILSHASELILSLIAQVLSEKTQAKIHSKPLKRTLAISLEL
ncbi:hypothetical protein H6G74_11770 [Nostoc spongiaeforme FACHB-130]|uniref:Uncharacterized protein n=1 Tax=Nostoc spongiaeforme FACHB-130 TaxID=1357510 RepID=A0ABR8FU97_9NOSO|nr:hypothetical protein [Nostoc spongiaeforme]MBD2595005.1 hypothetical protein [Nostoc spongiaeforme FACHB-130]